MTTPVVPRLNPERLRRLIAAFSKPKILVVGDCMLDEFIWGQVNRISPEAPVPVVWVQSESVMPGGAANVANNIRSLGGRVQMAGVIGTDPWGDTLVETLTKRGIGTEGLLREPSRATTVKTRVIAHHQQVVRVDRESRPALNPAIVKRMAGAVRKQLEMVDAVIIEDYGKRVITRELLQQVVPLMRSRRKLITVDPKEEHFDLYQEVTAITPNRAEASAMVGRRLETEQEVRQAGGELVRRLRCEAVVMTLGEDGMCVMEQHGRCTRIPTVAQEVFDVAGAGDTVIATLTLALASGASMPEAAVLANYAAGIVVGKLGVATAAPEELLAKLDGTTTRRTAHGARRTARNRPPAFSRNRR
ncbi:MAG TPA: D-glycero-beta-D-manno-heptose-7-phosphate kinase [Candidatus Omnitrophica bacterium]|nr:D-glycero-beta-D-manno-heptose-7-phosphate kinase [Candidatus Omnitrophota bacterium]